MRGVLEFWQAVEMFSPPPIAAARASRRVFDLGPGDPLPWSARHPIQREGWSST